MRISGDGESVPCIASVGYFAPILCIVKRVELYLSYKINMVIFVQAERVN